jgi:hypothetical protein
VLTHFSSVCPVEISELYYEQAGLIEDTNKYTMTKDNGVDNSDSGAESSDESESIGLSGVELEGD